MKATAFIAPPYGARPPTIVFTRIRCGNRTRHVYYIASFGAGFGPDFAQNCHQAASPLAFGLRKRLFG